MLISVFNEFRQSKKSYNGRRIFVIDVLVNKALVSKVGYVKDLDTIKVIKINFSLLLMQHLF